jgi:hypothetical protein
MEGVTAVRGVCVGNRLSNPTHHALTLRYDVTSKQKKTALKAILAAPNDLRAIQTTERAPQSESEFARPSRSAYNAAWVRFARCNLPRIRLT